MAKTVWVKNTENTPIAASALIKGKPGEDAVRTTVTLAREKIDQASGRIVSNGYTEVDAGVFKAIVDQNPVIKAFINKGTIEVYDEMPEDASTPAQKLVILRQELADAKAEIATLRDTVTTLTAENKALKEQVKKNGKKPAAPGAAAPDAVAAAPGAAAPDAVAAAAAPDAVAADAGTGA